MDLEGSYDATALKPQGQWALAWRRLKRDRVAVACGCFLILIVLAVGPGAPLYGKLVGHGPNEFFPYAVSVGLRPAGPFTVTWDPHEGRGRPVRSPSRGTRTRSSATTRLRSSIRRRQRARARRSCSSARTASSAATSSCAFSTAAGS